MCPSDRIVRGISWTAQTHSRLCRLESLGLVSHLEWFLQSAIGADGGVIRQRQNVCLIKMVALMNPLRNEDC